MTRPDPIPRPDRYQLENLNALYAITGESSPGGGWRGRVKVLVLRAMGRLLHRQQHFNAAVVDHINRNAVVGNDAHLASVKMLDWMEETLSTAQTSAEALLRHREALLARERRATLAVDALAAAHEELRTSIGVLQSTTQNLRREIAELSRAGKAGGMASGVGSAPVPSALPAQPALSPSSALPAPSPLPAFSGFDVKYVGFEDQFRGTQEDIRQRLTAYLPLFAGASDVLDIGCGRGEFLALLREQGVSARGVDVNRAMVEVCHERGLEATAGDALAYLQSLPDGSLGGLLAAQVVEHLEPSYLSALLDAAFAKLRPGSTIVLETINPACWFAFFESYIRDITHVRPLHPETLKYLLLASGFQHADIRYSAPYPEHDKLQPVATAPDLSLMDWADTINANVDKINRLLFTWLDYAAIARRP